MQSSAIRSDILLLLTATIWGFAFVAQRMGMEFVGPFTFNGVRFALGSLSLVPLLIIRRRQREMIQKALPLTSTTAAPLGGALAGAALFLGASLQQVGLVYTTAGKAGFITGLYVVIVPNLGRFCRQRP
ncbi:MAG: DMT family transporter, partial [Desulfobacterales bacterium]|nr:DMT family transporter [Desulfobacterales bacterium]